MSRQLSIHPDTPTKIGIIGAKEVGKTTLANLLNGHLKSLGASSDLVHETARNSPSLLNENSTLETAYWLFGTQIAAETLVQTRRQFTICDRTVIDLYPFTAYALNMQGEQGENSIDPNELKSLKTLIKSYVIARPYEFLFYVPIRSELWEFYSLPSNSNLQQAIDAGLRRFVIELQLSYHIITSLDSYERVEEVMKVIQGKYRFEMQA